MPIYKLSDDNFDLVGRQKKTLVINVPGVILVFFKMNGCPGCETFQPILERLAGIDTRLNYGVINISDNKKVVQKSRETDKTVINTVPFIIFFVDGRPKAIYRGKRNVSSIQSFIGKMLSGPRSAPSFMPAGERSYTQPGHAGFSGHQPISPGGKAWMPEGLKKPSSMSGVVKGHSSYAQLGDLEDEDDQKLLIPAEVTPHNLPWESRKYDSLGE